MNKFLFLAATLLIAASAHASLLVCKGQDVHMHSTLDRAAKVVVHQKGQSHQKFDGEGYVKVEKAKRTYLFNFGEGQRLQAELYDFPQTGANGVWTGSERGAVSLRCRLKVR